MSDFPQQIVSPQPVDGVSPIGSAVNNNRFSRLHMTAASPDWMAPLSQRQSRGNAAAASNTAATAPSAPAPVGAAAGTTALQSARNVGFLSMFYRGSTLADSTAATHSGAVHKVPQPPAAIDDTATPPRRPFVVPVDVSLSLDAAVAGHPQTAAVRVASPIRREAVRGPMAIGSDTWNALGTVPLPRAKPVRLGAAAGRSAAPHPVAPASIDAALSVTATAPRPLWSDLPAAAGVHSRAPEPFTAPTLDAFSAVRRRVPEAPKPISTSPTRASDRTDCAPTATPSGAPLLVPAPERATGTAHALRPVGEDDAPLTPVRRPVETARGGFFRGAQVRPPPTGKGVVAANPFAGLTFATMRGNDSDSNSDDDGLMLPSDLATLNMELNDRQQKAVEAAAPPQAVATVARTEAQKNANAQNFLSTLFSSVSSPVTTTVQAAFNKPEEVAEADPVAPTSPVVSRSATARLANALMSFNALEVAIGGGATAATASGGSKKKEASAAGTAPGSLTTQQSGVDYSSYFATPFDEFDEDSEESLDHLKRVVSIVMQTAKQQQQADDAAVNGGSSYANATSEWRMPTQSNVLFQGM